MSKTELLAKEVDDMSSISFRAQNETQHEIKEAIEIVLSLMKWKCKKK